MNLAFYREFRPKNFDEVIGQNYVVETLKNQIRYNRLTHAYLFSGPRGTGKTSVAKIFAKAINCTSSPDGNPCGVCEACKNLSSSNTDIVEIDAASNNRVEDIRDLREKVGFPPMYSKYKVYIVDEVHMLSDSAFNALLKTLEEPPKHAIFILATTEVHKLPATILSRCSRFDFKLLPMETLVGLLKSIFDKKNISYDDRSLYLIAKAGEGSARDMLSIADSVASFCSNEVTVEKTEEIIGLSDRESIKNILQAIQQKDVNGIFISVKQILSHGKNVQVLCKEMADFIKTLILVKSNVKDCVVLNILTSEFEKYENFSKLFDIDFLKFAFIKFAYIELDLKYSLNPENLFESTCLGLLDYGKAEQMPTEKTKTTNIQTPDVKIEKVQDVKLQTETDKLWGNVLLKVKENNLFALSNALQSVIKVDKIENKLLIMSNDQGCTNLIDNPDRLDVILKLTKSFDSSIDEIIVEYDNAHASLQDVKDNLKQVFKSKIKFKS